MTLQVANASSIIFMPLIAEFSRRFPLTTLKIKSVTTSECRALVLNRDVDIGLFPLVDENQRAVPAGIFFAPAGGRAAAGSSSGPAYTVVGQ